MEDLNFPYKLSIPTDVEAEKIHEKIDAFNANQLSFNGNVEVLKDYIFKDNDVIIAGIRSCFYLGECLSINVLFVDEKYRHNGLGTLLLNKVENEAKAMGAKLVHLDTFDFQAKDFYLKHGYEIFGVLEDCPKGHKRYYLKKILQQ
ncbi:MAG: GNAT family N-acetyltransferase [Proteobacteria bacterium]|nr:GNAT family N-acetyltransferase [Pseudomonadota bacterium]